MSSSSSSSSVHRYASADGGDGPPPSSDGDSSRTRIRNLVAFWFLGICNNYGYVIMLSAAYDILLKGIPLTDIETSDTFPASNLTNATEVGRFDCNPISTGAVLLADVLPTLIIKLTAPWFVGYISYNIIVAVCVLASMASFLIVSLAHAVPLSLLGVVFASVSSGLGEFAFVSLMSFYDKNVVSTWSSGTGAAGLVGALSYAGLTEVLSPRHAVLVMLVAPVLMAISFWVILVKAPASRSRSSCRRGEDMRQLLPNDSRETEEEEEEEGINKDPEAMVKTYLTFGERLHHIRHLLNYMIPLLLVYFAEYFINQGLLELIYFKGIWLDHQGQYRWFQVLYQLGVFISRSSVNIVKFTRIWIFSIIQMCNLVLIFTVAYYAYLPSIAIVFALILVEGLVGGAAYVNTFYQIRQNEAAKYKEFAMGTTTVADSMGITLAGAIALPVHNTLCGLK